MKDHTDKHNRSLKKKLVKSYAAWTRAPASEETEYTKQSNCHICGAKHDMDNCTFSKNTVEERSRTLAKKKLCYGCYIPITADPNARTFSNRRVYKICNQKHPTDLQGNVPKRRGGSNIVTTSSANPIENDNLAASSVPVATTLLRWT